ncbi:hypothetical protein [Sedimentitalea nanhaiensis]|uniref:Uncharacterized protein n=1 Tax=Sedimentitalea nanhaiensis TaxID=999627 RepID=A0A1I7AMW7_9RHOB|nr:hypothetical protein [Sedimentitalea nanhaiensis]SFT76234.1 hypothetical protein SAMN05216236_10767 [Sedimentitalea nanhaiensis]
MTKRPFNQTKTMTAPRPTRAAALLLATALSIPVFVLLSLIDWLLL